MPASTIVAQEPERRSAAGQPRPVSSRRADGTPACPCRTASRRSSRSSSATTTARCSSPASCRREGFDVRAIRPPSVAAGHGPPADFGQRGPHGRRSSTGSPARCRWRCGNPFRAPRPLRNRHRHRRRQDRRRRRPAPPLSRRVSAAVLEADSDRHRAGRRHGRGDAAGGVLARRTRFSTAACGCSARCRRTWRRGWRGRADRARRRSSRRSTPNRRVGRWIVEGAGGVLVPINDARTMADLMPRLALPVVIVARIDARHHQPHAADDRGAAAAVDSRRRRRHGRACRTRTTATRSNGTARVEVLGEMPLFSSR